MWIFNKVQKKVFPTVDTKLKVSVGCVKILRCSTKFEGVNESKLVFLAQAEQHKIKNTLLHDIIGMRCKTWRFHGEWKW